VFSSIKNKIQNKKILILGFGKEGRASLKFFKKYFPENEVAVADSNADLRRSIDEKLSKETDFYFGDSYLKNIDNYDLIIKSPGIPSSLLNGKVSDEKIASQTDIFLSLFRDQVIGITGTKGKSTTSSLIYHILAHHSDNVMLAGNIGIPVFELIDKIDDETKIIFELSSHQLENVTVSPRISVLLNLFEEHLDHYSSLKEYYSAKLNIMKFQKEGDIFIFNADDFVTGKYLQDEKVAGRYFPYSVKKVLEKGVFIQQEKVIFSDGESLSEFDFVNRQGLPGQHNLQNIMAAVAVTKLLGVDDGIIQQSVTDFKGLPHRLEFIGEFKGISFYNDSIATIPEATIEAVKTLKNVDTLILGGKDRGIDYNSLIDFIIDSKLRNVIFIGDAGKRIYAGIKVKNKAIQPKLFLINKFDDITDIVREFTAKSSVCLLSPAASSYDMFESFVERGEAFKKIAENL
jgi:UDP-N-acetylmuramoylalanine--D-glutamate ligase